MPACPQCAAFIPPGFKFCGMCGFQVPEKPRNRSYTGTLATQQPSSSSSPPTRQAAPSNPPRPQVPSTSTPPSTTRRALPTPTSSSPSVPLRTPPPNPRPPPTVQSPSTTTKKRRGSDSFLVVPGLQQEAAAIPKRTAPPVPRPPALVPAHSSPALLNTRNNDIQPIPPRSNRPPVPTPMSPTEKKKRRGSDSLLYLPNSNEEKPTTTNAKKGLPKSQKSILEYKQMMIQKYEEQQREAAARSATVSSSAPASKRPPLRTMTAPNLQPTNTQPTNTNVNGFNTRSVPVPATQTQPSLSSSPSTTQITARPAALSNAPSRQPKRAAATPLTTHQPTLTDAPLEKKAGWLTKQGHGLGVTNWKRRYFILEGSTLTYFKQVNDPKPAGVINLSTAQIEAAPYTAHEFCFRIAVPNKDYYIYADSVHIFNDWMSSLAMAGATNLDLQRVLDRKKTEARAEKTPEQRKAEEYYLTTTKFQEKEQREEVERMREKYVPRTDLVNCTCQMSVVGTEMKDKILLYKIEVKFGLGEKSKSVLNIMQKWFCFRNWDQCCTLVTKLKQKGVKLPDHLISNRTAKVEERRKLLDGVVSELVRLRPLIFQNPKTQYLFCVFIAPVQLGDIKEPGFIMPFDLTEPPK